MAPDKPPGIIGKLAGAVAKRDRLAALKARFERRDPQEIERALADLGLTCGDYTPAEPDDAILHHLLPEMLERLKFDGETAWEDMNFMQTLRKACYGCPTESRHRCQVWLGWAEAEDDYHEFCPNAEKLDTLARKA